MGLIEFDYQTDRLVTSGKSECPGFSRPGGGQIEGAFLIKDSVKLKLTGIGVRFYRGRLKAS